MKIKNSISPRYSLSTSTRAGYFYHSYYGGIDKIFHTKDELEDYKTKINTILNNKGDGKISKTIFSNRQSCICKYIIFVHPVADPSSINNTRLSSTARTQLFSGHIHYLRRLFGNICLRKGR